MRFISIATLVLGIGLFIIAVKLRVVTAAIGDEVLSEDSRYYLPPAPWLRAFSLGYNEFVADLIWTKTLVYYGKQRALTDPDDLANIEKNNTHNYLLTASYLDPRFEALYVKGHAILLFQYAMITEQAVTRSIELLAKGMKEFPEHGGITFEFGFMHWFEMRPFVPKDRESPKARLYRETGEHYIRKAALMTGAPSYTPLFAASLIETDGGDEYVIEHLESALVKETDPKVRRVLLRKLREMRGAAAEQLVARVQSLQSVWRSELPYMPFDLFLITQSQVSIKDVLDPLHWTNRVLGLTPNTPEDGSD